MKTKYDKKSDAKYIQIKKGKIFNTKKIENWLFFDFSKKGEVLGVEILNASKNPLVVSTLAGRFIGCGQVDFYSYKESQMGSGVASPNPEYSANPSKKYIFA